MKKLKIAYIMKSFSANEKDAAIITILDLARELRSRGHDAAIITNRGHYNYYNNKRLKKFEVIKGVPVYRPYCLWSPAILTKHWFTDIPFAGWFNYFIAPALGVRAVEREMGSFDIIHGSSAAPFLALRTILAKLLSRNAKAVHSIKSLSSSRFGALFVKLLNRVDVVTVPLQSLKNLFIQKGIKQNKINVLHSFRNLSSFKPKNKETLKKKYGFERKKVVLYFGHYNEYKGVLTLLRAIPELIKKDKDIKIIIAHPTWLLPKHKAEISQFDINNAITVLEQDKKPYSIVDYINLADVVVLPYKTLQATEAQPACIIESLACKTPVITSCLPELGEVFENGRDLLMVEPGEPDDLKNKIIQVLYDKKLQKKLKESGHKKAMQFGVANGASVVLDIYKKILGKSQKS